MINPRYWFEDTAGNCRFPNAPNLFVDLDGVCADFDQGYLDFFGHAADSVDDDTMWATIRARPNFFADLPLCPHTLWAWDLIKSLKPMMLTACPEKDYEGIATQKHAWSGKNLPRKPLVIPIVRGKNKARLVQQPGDILIDDFEKNCLPWQDAGGVAILHTNWPDTLAQLRTVLGLREIAIADEKLGLKI